MSKTDTGSKHGDAATDFDVIVVGAGFAGLYMLYRLRRAGFSVRVYEAGGGVGGTWYWNRYPGARCDAVSMEYSYQFSEALQQDWEWTETYASQPEILRYLNHVADRFALRDDLQFNTRVEEITCDGVKAVDRHYPLDVLVFATGFDAMTGALLKIDIVGRAGLSLRQKWQDGPLNYLGLAVAGFPNLFMITGPGSPSVLSNMVPSIEQHVDWITRCLQYLVTRSCNRIEAEAAAETAWVAHVNDVAAATLFSACDSWYLGANIPGKPRIFMPYLGVPPYVEKCNSVAENDYAGFRLTP